jgi:hypothetical protein
LPSGSVPRCHVDEPDALPHAPGRSDPSSIDGVRSLHPHSVIVASPPAYAHQLLPTADRRLGESCFVDHAAPSWIRTRVHDEAGSTDPACSSLCQVAVAIGVSQ